MSIAGSLASEIGRQLVVRIKPSILQESAGDRNVILTNYQYIQMARFAKVKKLEYYIIKRLPLCDL